MIAAGLHFRCPACHGSQYRISRFDVTDKNPHGAKCIFCKAVMLAGNVERYDSYAMSHSETNTHR
ncbi:cold-shock protein [Cronobacter dublinensis]|uniref:Cold-shock protein n=2 Tax=Cronobacter dublinensis TaxID=413497 RepID=A0A9Q4T1S7_9ENTR|nr:cold-shock protein [Cronobacter dublinensis]EKM6456973.1 cold-shock protein [Cronobacter dublinensis]EKP4475854.1 cold-shock protein [Cronobacter dublinensis]EKY3201019.1 cold-shock protein [Cronobacter dublinensis]EKY3221847.1 cold-shock protein [Cronobacter dublinensis]EKY3243958.1 cold-shock protein [Cronobacter dublinensis]